MKTQFSNNDRKNSERISRLIHSNKFKIVHLKFSSLSFKFSNNFP